MVKSKLHYLFLFVFIFPSLAFNQTTNINNSSFTDDWNDDYDVINWYSDSRPFMELNYGLGQPKHKNFNSKFSDIGEIELRLGFSDVDFMFRKSIIELKEKFMLFSYYTYSFTKDTPPANELRSQMTRIGFGDREGYGYRVGIFSLVPYSQNGYVWSRLDMKDFPLAAGDNEVIERYNKTFRFGDYTEGGIKLGIGKVFSIHGSYEASVIYPRHLFWKWAGSAILEGAGRNMIGWFVDEIFDASPGAAPIVHFLLTNAWNYAYYSFKRDKMNWPFNTEMPLTFETIKLGVTFTF